MVSSQSKSGRRRQWLFRFAAIAVGLLPFFVIEGIFALIGWGAPNLSDDPFVGYSDVLPLFELSGDGTTYAISSKRLKYFAADSFPADKSDDEFRIFCLGGSTVQGRPYSIETSFTTWLELALHVSDASHDWNVVNCGGISYASYRLVPILEECLQYEPDLIILCTGHNEFLEDRTYGHLKQIPDWAERPLYWMNQLRTVNVARDLLREADGSSGSLEKTILKEDADAILNYRHGPAAYHRDPEWHEGIRRHFAFNIERMIALCRRARVPLIVVRPTSNLSDCPPFKSVPTDGLTDDEQQRVNAYIEDARAQLAKAPLDAVASFQAALELDPGNALTHYELGQCQLALGQFTEARASFVAARDNDICPLRMTSPLETTLQRIVKRGRVPFLNAHELLEDRTGDGILGGFWLVDHVHPSFEGHQQIGLTLVKTMHDLKLVDPRAGWEAASRPVFARHFDSLSRLYFHEGQRQLKMVRLWSHGKADGPEVRMVFPHRVGGDVPDSGKGDTLKPNSQ